MGCELKLTLIRSKMSGRPQSTRISPRKFSEKIALLNKKEREANAKFEQIINEVHSTISQPQGQPQQPAHKAQYQQQQQQQQQQPIDSNRVTGLQFTSEELQAMIESTRYQAAHSDSLEEIERVYENLMRSVGQCDYPQSINQQQQQQPLELSKQCLQQQQFITRTTANSDHLQSRSNSTTTTISSPMIAPSAPFYQQQQQNNQFHSTNLDLNNNDGSNQASRDAQASHSINYIPCELAKSGQRPASSISSKSLFSGHNVLDTCVSSSYLPHAIHQQQQDICIPDSQTRGRVVSFGSASRDRYRGAAIISQLAAGQQQALEAGSTNAHEPMQQQQKTQYLEEPSGERCRQKSCSDPQLNVQAAPAQYSIGPIDQCTKSDNRLAMNSGQPPSATGSSVGHTTSPFNCCSNATSGPIEIPKSSHMGHHQHQHQQPDSNAEYFHIIKSGLNRQQLRQTGQVSTTTASHFHTCDTTNSRATSELPGIKICTISDNGQQYGLPSGDLQRQQVFNGNEREPGSRDSSLPDISNLQFGNNSTGTSPENHHYEQPSHWPEEAAGNSNDSTGQQYLKQEDGVQMGEPCEPSSATWRKQYSTPPDAEVKMEVQDQLMPVSSNQPQEAACWPANTSDNQQQQLQHALKVGSNLSSSDYGFTTSSSHYQQGNLMICTSGELYNNIFRSRSHSNIDYLAKQASQAKRPHLYAENLPQSDEHHTSQYCLQTGEQPVMNVRRIAELKAQGTSTSPLNSSSNLNSPQSDVNSPGSSTTEQCEPAMLFASSGPATAVTNQQDFYQINAETGTQFVQYAPASTTMLDPHQQQQQQQPVQTHLKSTTPTFGGAQIMAQQAAAMGESFMEQPGGAGEQQQQHQAAMHPQLCRASPTGLFTTSSSPSSTTTTTDSLNYINNER